VKWIRERWVALLWFVVFTVLVLRDNYGFRLTARGVLWSTEKSEVHTTRTFEGGRAYLVDGGDPARLFRLACRSGPLWRECGQVYLFPSLIESPIVPGSADTPEEVQAFAGFVRDERVVKVTAGGQQQDIAEDRYFLFVWKSDNPTVYLPATALDPNGQILYRVELNVGDPVWKPAK